MAGSEDEGLRLPWFGELSPGQLGNGALAETLKIVNAHAGDRAAIREAVRKRWFDASAESRASDPESRLVQQLKRAGNVLIGMQSNGLVSDKTYHLTDLGVEIEALDHDVDREARFATHLLKHGRGLELLDVVRDLRQRGVVIQNDALRDELRRRGYTVTVNSGDAGKLRQWLGLAGVVDERWIINETRLTELTTVSTEVLVEWQALTQAQQAFLATIRRIGETRADRPMSSPELLNFVRVEHGPVFDEGQVARIYTALATGGWITHSVAKSGGRGGKGGDIAATAKLLAIDFEVLVGFRPGDLPADLRAILSRPLDEIYGQLGDADTYVKGLALEYLAVNLATDLGLTPLQLRVRGVRTGGAEVDLVAEAAHLHYTRWLFQCKNTSRVDVGVLAKEVGMATLLQAQVIVIATTGRFSQTVTSYADRVTQTTPFQVVLIDGAALESYRAGGAMALRARLHDAARAALQLKRPQVLETLGDIKDS